MTHFRSEGHRKKQVRVRPVFLCTPETFPGYWEAEGNFESFLALASF